MEIIGMEGEFSFFDLKVIFYIIFEVFRMVRCDLLVDYYINLLCSVSFFILYWYRMYSIVLKKKIYFGIKKVLFWEIFVIVIYMCVMYVCLLLFICIR